MKLFVSIKKRDYLLLGTAAFCILLGITTWITFWPIFNSIMSGMLQFRQNKDHSLQYSAFLFTNPPANTVLKFFFFNITNPDEVTYNGAKPELIEVGGYGFLESEQKKYIDFNDDSTKMFYQNYKNYKYSFENTDAGYFYEDKIVFPNPIATGAVSTVFSSSYNFSSTIKTLFSIGSLLLGEHPIISQRVDDLIFEGYNDPFLDFVHSDFFNIALDILGQHDFLPPRLVPPMTKFALFYGYNGTYDDNYWVNTGTKNVNDVGKVESWAGSNNLPEHFYPTEYAREIRGADSGSMCKTHLTNTDEIPFFMSFMCRSFNKNYQADGSVDGIPSMIFSVPYEEFDTTLEKNAGFRYKNDEHVNYYPDWPGNENRCVRQNRSTSPCEESNVENDTYLLPPGMYPMVCYPGHTTQPPFNVLISPPHFLYSPEQVQKSLSGIHPDPQKHSPFVFHHQQTSGTVMQVDIRFQINIPFSQNNDTILTSQLPNAIIPLLYQSSHATVKDFVYNKIWVGFVVVPLICTIFKFVILALGVCIFTFWIFTKIDF